MSESLLRFAEVSLGPGGLPSAAGAARLVAVAPRSLADVSAEAAAAIERWDHGLYGPGPNLSFVGAEPFSHPDLPAIVFGAVEDGASRIRLRTAAEALKVAENAAGVVQAGVRHFEVVVLADTHAHDELAARPGSFAMFSHGVARFVEASREMGVAVAIAGRVPVCRHNLEHLPTAVAALSRLGASEIVLDVSANAAATVGAGSSISSACDTGIVNGTWVSVATPTPIAALPALHLLSVAAGTASDDGSSVGGSGS